MIGVALLIASVEYWTWDKVIPIHEETARFIENIRNNPVAMSFTINSRIVEQDFLNIASFFRDSIGIGAFGFVPQSIDKQDTVIMPAYPPNGGGAYCETSFIKPCWICRCCGSVSTVCVLLYVTGDGYCIYRCDPCPAPPPDCNEPPGDYTGKPSDSEIIKVHSHNSSKESVIGNSGNNNLVEVYTVGGKLIYRGPSSDVERMLKRKGLKGLFLIREHVDGRVLNRKIFIR